ncbi:hypothetical protein D3C76_1403270 [compost metagenome]
MDIDNTHFDANGRATCGVHLAAVVMRLAVILGRKGSGHGRQFGHAVTLEEAGGGECLPGSIKQDRGNGRCAITDGRQRAELKARQLRMFVPAIQKHLDHGRGQQNFADALMFDGFQYHLRNEGGQDDVGAPT